MIVFLVLWIDDAGDELLLVLLLVLGGDGDGGDEAAVRDKGLLHAVAVNYIRYILHINIPI